MSIIKSIKQVLGLGPAAENHFWDGSVPNQLILKRGTPDAPGAELIKVLNGVLSFPNQGQSLAQNGYIKLPGGLIVQWGLSPSGVTGNQQIFFPIPFPTMCLGVQTTAIVGGAPTSVMTANLATPPTTSEFTASKRYTNGATAAFGNAAEQFYWIAIGY